MRRRGYRVTPVDVDRDIADVLKGLKPDVAFNALHGRVGEDGTLQGVLEILRIPYTHSGVLASALAMQKDLAKTVLKAAGVPVAHGLVVDRREAARRHALEPPYVLKPVSEGSSFGVVIVKADRAHPPQEVGREDWPYGDRLLAERYVAGKELTCAVIGDRATDIIDIQPVSEAFYGYDAKYAKGGSIHVLPAKIKPKIYHEVQNLTLKAHRALGCRGVSRADFRWDETKGEDGELVCLEVNTQPGMTETSLVPEMAAHAGLTLRRVGGVDGGGRVLRSLSDTWPWRRQAEPALAGAGAGRSARRRVLLRGERARRDASVLGLRSTGRRRAASAWRWRSRCLSPRPASARCAAANIRPSCAPRAASATSSRAALGFGVQAITMTGQSRLTPREVLEHRRHQPEEFDAVLRRRRGARAAREDAAHQSRRASASSIPARSSSTWSSARPPALWQRNGEIKTISADGAVIDELRDTAFHDLPFVVGEGANERLPEFRALLDAN